MLLLFLLINTVLLFTYLTLVIFFYGALPRPTKSLDLDLPFVSVIVPARNEETKIERCLQSLCLQDYPQYEVIAVDDQSTDNTGIIIEKVSKAFPIVHFLSGKKTPEGWIGKCNALVQAVPQSRGSWLLFTDADTCHQPNSIRDAVAFAQSRKADLVSFMPLQELGSIWEKAVMPVLLAAFVCGDPFHQVNNPASKRAYAYGQYTLVEADAYKQIGGHAAIRSEILEDHALARKAKESGLKIIAADGRSLYKVRMYTNLVTLWHGWTKNLFALIDCNLLNLLLVVAMMNAAIIGPYICAGIAVSQLWHAPGPFLFAETLMVILQFVTLHLIYKITSSHWLGTDWRHFFLWPAGAAFATCLFVQSAYLVLSGSRVTWKGRGYVVNTDKTIEAQGKATTLARPYAKAGLE